MLGNTIQIANTVGGETTYALSLNDVDNGSAVYRYNISAADSINLKIQNLQTKENKPVGTSRIQVRLERIKTLADGTERSLFASVVLASPRDNTFTANDRLNLVFGLVTLLGSGLVESFSSADTPPGWTATSANGATLVTRLFAGEV